ncbi:hypothetical protein [Thermosporothrix hazakensis]|jgi:hypothetical protein|nr:hypothetical protein [Thermosporothrix hazakensis]BBH89790.1 hypothetical protein KTC_45410 [Thermosporothrix sp. COM3]GCE47979.1 hypothetical protein KTH_28480 [Thermosporothrix hazakensis]
MSNKQTTYEWHPLTAWRVMLEHVEAESPYNVIHRAAWANGRTAIYDVFTLCQGEMPLVQFEIMRMMSVSDDRKPAPLRVLLNKIGAEIKVNLIERTIRLAVPAAASPGEETLTTQRDAVLSGSER